MTPSRNKLIYLESLRGLAALAVVLHHLRLAFFPPAKPAVVALAHPAVATAHHWSLPSLSIFVSGMFSVRLFFLLSGFVLSISYMRRKESAILTSAALRRYPRLMIPALASVLFGWVILHFHGFRNVAAAAAMNQPAGAWLASFAPPDPGLIGALRQGLFGIFFHYVPTRSLNTVLWTMPIELAGSFCVFSFLALMGRVQKRSIVYLVTFIILWRTQQIYLMDFLWGLILCDIYVRTENSPKQLQIPFWLSIPMFIGGFALGGLAVGWASTNTYVPLIPVDNIPTIASFLIVAAAVFSAPIQTILEHAVISFFGRLSFPLYLFHHAIICSLGCAAYIHLRNSAFSHVHAAAISCLLSVTVSVLVAWGAYYAVELPAIRAGSTLAKYFHLPKPSAMSSRPASAENSQPESSPKPPV